ncbi:WD repeat-containing protein 25 isoform X1 [Gasterosteus aculeatus]
MSSLVAYEDSEPEDDSPKRTEEVTSASIQTGCYEPNQGVRLFDSSRTIPSPPCSATPDPDRSVLVYRGDVSERRSSSLCPQPQPHSCFGWESKRCRGGTARDERLRDTAGPRSLPETRGKISPTQSHSFDGGLSPAKRNPTVRSGVRPYVPKRQRPAASSGTVDPKHPAERVPGSLISESQILLDVSARVKPYLAHKAGASGIPRRLLMSLGGHRGPVNTVQWCPVPHLSHLLLSASMDKTFKVWDGAESGRCLRVYACHSGAVRDARWTPCGRHLLSGSFDNTAVITDVETGSGIGQPVQSDARGAASQQPRGVPVWRSQFNGQCLGLSQLQGQSYYCPTVVKVYKAGIQQTLDILFLRGGASFITSSDCVSRDSADRTLIAWDYQTTAKVSNQIYQERYTCPSLALHPLEESFVAQTNGDYMAVFSSQQPYRMNKRRRYEGHKVQGYAVQCEFSPDGTILASGSSSGSAHFYDFHNAHTLHTLRAHSQPCLCVSQHPVLPATAATCDWAGEIKVWH